MKNDRVFRYAMVGGLSLVFVFLIVVVAQLHAIEERFIVQNQQLRALGEATERLKGGGASLVRGSKASSGDEIPPGVKVLHPDVENFLKPKETHWPPPGAPMNGVLARPWEYGDPKGFNMLLENSSTLFEYVQAYCLFRLAERNFWTDPEAYHASLAWRIEVTDDSKEFTAYLRPGVKWHPVSGVNLDDPKYAWLRGEREVTAHDLVFTLDLIVNPQVQSGPWKNYYAGLESWKALDDHTFVVRWKKKEYLNLSATVELWPSPRFLYMADQDGRPIPKETLGLRFNQHWYNNKGFVNAGPYRMTSYEPGSKVIIERNESFVGEKPAIQKIVYSIYSDLKQTLLKLKAHEIGVGELVPGQYRSEILDYEKAGRKPKNSPFFDGRIQCQKILRPAYSYVGWNAGRPMFADKRVRRALTHAFDRQRIIDNVYVGLGTIASGPFAPDSPNNDPDIRPIPFDLAAAKKLLAEAGWTDSDGDGLVDKELHAGDGKRTPFEFRLILAAGIKESEVFAKIFADDLLKIGVKMIVEPLEWALVLKRKDERQFDAFTASWMITWIPDLYQFWHSSQADLPKGSNAVGFRNAEADKIIERIRVTFDKDERIRLFRAFHRIVHDEQPYSFFMARKKVYCAWNEVKNLVFSKDLPIENSLPWFIATTAPSP
jgi:peptide/nickel transport system substrate-binding protein